MCADRARRRVVAGQALVETVVGTLALVPLVLGVVWLGKIQSIQQAAIAASRVVAFECTVRPDRCLEPAGHAELADEVRRRLFSRSDAPVFTADRLAGDATAPERHPLWTDAAGRALIERYADVGVRVDPQRFDAGASLATSRAGSIAADAARMLSELAGPGRFGLAIDEGIVDAKIQANVAASRADAAPSAPRTLPMPLRVHAHTAILADAWTASGPYAGHRSVAARVEQGARLEPAYEASIDLRYLPVRGLILLMHLIGLEPDAGAFEYHHVDVDLVPPDRIGAPDNDGAGPTGGGSGGRGGRGGNGTGAGIGS